MKNICTFDDCGRTSLARGLCNGHYKQYRKGQELCPLQADVPVCERFEAFIDFNGPVNPKTGTACHLWNPGASAGRYGRFWIDGSMLLAHRVAWELYVGPIPDGYEIDHDHPERGCHNKLCVNVEHLLPVTDNNTRLRTNTSGEPNISWHDRGQHWLVRVRVGSERHTPSLIGLPSTYKGTKDSVPPAAVEARDLLRAHLGVSPIIKAVPAA